MKKFTTLLFILISIGVSAQLPQLEITPNGIEPIVVEFPDKTAAELYTNTKEWILKNYHNPSKVLKADLENKELRIEGFEEYVFKAVMANFHVSYMITIQFKEGKYRFDYDVIDLHVAGGSKALYGIEVFFKKDGPVKKSYQNAKTDLETSMNKLSYSLFKYQKGVTQKVEDDW